MDDHTDDTSPIDIDVMRAPAIMAHRLTGLDAPRTFYYDETNNIRRLRLSEGALNVADPACFVLGGVVHSGPPRPIDLTSLRSAIRAQPSATEIKFKHVAHGDFLTMLGSAKLGAYLGWLESESLHAHFSVLDPVYWSTVDIIDSVVVSATPHFMMFAPNLKTDLATALRHDLAATARLFHDFDYPEVPPERADAFLEALAAAVTASSALAPANAAAVAEVLRSGKGLPALPFLEGETAGVLIDSFREFYLHRFYLFADADHVLDTEPEIIERLAPLQFVRAGRPFRNFRFVERSADEPGVQASDILMGLLGHLFTWLRDTELSVIASARASLSGRAATNRLALARLLDQSTDSCPAFAHYVLSLLEQKKASIFLAP